MLRTLPLLVCLTFSVTRPANAQSLDAGLELFDDGELEDAALTFYDVAARDPDANKRNEALVYLALSLQRMGLWAPASFYFQVILEDGPSNRRFLNAVEQLLEIQETYRDHVFIADLIDKNFDNRAFANLPNGARIDQINYLMGEFNLRRGKVRNAKRFLEFVRADSAYYGRAQYLLGLVTLRQEDPGAAVGHFGAVVTSIAADTADDDAARLRQLAMLAEARAQYGLGNYEASLEGFERVPRYSEFWFQALYEQAWAHYQEQNFGEALGALESVLSPYFAKRHVPEAYVIQGTAYFTYCQWDRVRRSVERYQGLYGPMKEQLDTYLAGARDPAEYLDDVIAGGAGKYAGEIAREVRRIGWFTDFYFMFRHLEWQRDRIAEIGEWRGSRLAEDVAQMIDDKVQNARAFAGAWVRQRLQFHADNMKNFQNQIDILDFELTDAERQWLEEGREILKGRRAQLPRPEIPNDQWQHWSMGKEYWKDELGYYQHTLQSECN